MVKITATIHLDQNDQVYTGNAQPQINSSSKNKLKKRSRTSSNQNASPTIPGSGTVIYVNAATWIKSNDSSYQCDFHNIFKGTLMPGSKVCVYHVVNNSEDVLIGSKELHIYQGRLWATNTNSSLHIFFQPAEGVLPFLGLKIKVVIQ